MRNLIWLTISNPTGKMRVDVQTRFDIDALFPALFPELRASQMDPENSPPAEDKKDAPEHINIKVYPPFLCVGWSLIA